MAHAQTASEVEGLEEGHEAEVHDQTQHPVRHEAAPFPAGDLLVVRREEAFREAFHEADHDQADPERLGVDLCLEDLCRGGLSLEEVGLDQRSHGEAVPDQEVDHDRGDHGHQVVDHGRVDRDQEGVHDQEGLSQEDLCLVAYHEEDHDPGDHDQEEGHGRQEDHPSSCQEEGHDQEEGHGQEDHVQGDRVQEEGHGAELPSAVDRVREEGHS